MIGSKLYIKGTKGSGDASCSFLLVLFVIYCVKKALMSFENHIVLTLNSLGSRQSQMR